MLGSICLALVAATGPAPPGGAPCAPPDVRGAWAAETYTLAGGVSHRVAGRIFFTDVDWQVLFFVMDDGEPKRGSGEGGTYSWDGDRLVLSHLFNLSVGEAVEGLPAAELRMVARDETQAETEPTRVAVQADRMTLYFPSGNRMTFRRRP